MPHQLDKLENFKNWYRSQINERNLDIGSVQNILAHIPPQFKAILEPILKGKLDEGAEEETKLVLTLFGVLMNGNADIYMVIKHIFAYCLRKLPDKCFGPNSVFEQKFDTEDCDDIAQKFKLFFKNTDNVDSLSTGCKELFSKTVVYKGMAAEKQEQVKACISRVCNFISAICKHISRGEIVSQMMLHNSSIRSELTEVLNSLANTFDHSLFLNNPVNRKEFIHRILVFIISIIDSLTHFSNQSQDIAKYLAELLVQVFREVPAVTAKSSAYVKQTNDEILRQSLQLAVNQGSKLLVTPIAQMSDSLSNFVHAITRISDNMLFKDEEEVKFFTDTLLAFVSNTFMQNLIHKKLLLSSPVYEFVNQLYEVVKNETKLKEERIKEFETFFAKNIALVPKQGLHWTAVVNLLKLHQFDMITYLFQSSVDLELLQKDLETFLKSNVEKFSKDDFDSAFPSKDVSELFEQNSDKFSVQVAVNHDTMLHLQRQLQQYPVNQSKVELILKDLFSRNETNTSDYWTNFKNKVLNECKYDHTHFKETITAKEWEYLLEVVQSTISCMTKLLEITEKRKFLIQTCSSVAERIDFKIQQQLKQYYKNEYERLQQKHNISMQSQDQLSLPPLITKSPIWKKLQQSITNILGEDFDEVVRLQQVQVHGVIESKDVKNTIHLISNRIDGYTSNNDFVKGGLQMIEDKMKDLQERRDLKSTSSKYLSPIELILIICFGLLLYSQILVGTSEHWFTTTLDAVLRIVLIIYSTYFNYVYLVKFIVLYNYLFYKITKIAYYSIRTFYSKRNIALYLSSVIIMKMIFFFVDNSTIGTFTINLLEVKFGIEIHFVLKALLWLI